MENDDEQLNWLMRRMEAAYQSVTGEPLPGDKLGAAVFLMQSIVTRIGLRPFAEALSQLLRYPHRMTVRKAGQYATPYAWIAQNGAAQLTPYVWQSGPTPWRMAAPMQESPNTP